MMCYRLCRILLLIGLCGSCDLVQAQPPMGYLSVSTEPVAQAVYVDSVLVGQTPIDAYALPAGPHHIRIPHPDRADWYARDYQDEVVIKADETWSVVVPFSGTLHILSEPFDAPVYIVDGLNDSGYLAGRTPLRLSNLDRGAYRISIRLPGYQEVVEHVAISEIPQTIFARLTPIGPVQINRNRPVQNSTNGRLHKILGYTTLAFGAVFSGLALRSDRAADRAYNRYLSTADPAALEQAFQSAARHDTRTTRYVIGAQVNFAATFYFFISHVFKDKKK